MIKFAAVLVSAFVLGIQPGLHQEPPMTFFITSAGPGDGANLGIPAYGAPSRSSWRSHS